MNYRPLGEGSDQIADRGTGAVGPAIDPGLVDTIAFLVGVTLKIIHPEVLFRGETPDRPFPGTGRGGLIDLVDFPVVRRSEVQSVKVVTGLERRRDRGRGIDYRLLVGTQEHLVRTGLSPRTPRESQLRLQARRAGSGSRLACRHRNVQETHLAQAILPEQAAPVAAHRDPDISGGDTAEIHDRVKCVVGLAGGSGKFPGLAQTLPGSTIEGVLDRGLFDPKPDQRLGRGVVIPYLHLMQGIDLIEFIPDPGRFPCRHDAAEPHLGRLDRVQVIGIQTRTVDRALRTFLRAVGARGGGLDGLAGQWHTDRLHREAPDLPLEDSQAGRCVDLIDPPVIRLAILQNLRRLIRGRRLTLADQHAPRIGPAGVVHVGDCDAEVNVMGRPIRSGLPAQNDIARHVHDPRAGSRTGRRHGQLYWRRVRGPGGADHLPMPVVGRAVIGSRSGALIEVPIADQARLIAQQLHLHGSLNLGLRTGHVPDPEFIDPTLKIARSAAVQAPADLQDGTGIVRRVNVPRHVGGPHRYAVPVYAQRGPRVHDGDMLDLVINEHIGDGGGRRAVGVEAKASGTVVVIEIRPGRQESRILKAQDHVRPRVLDRLAPEFDGLRPARKDIQHIAHVHKITVFLQTVVVAPLELQRSSLRRRSGRYRQELAATDPKHGSPYEPT